MFNFLLENNVKLENITIRGTPPLFWTIRESDLDFVLFLLEKGVTDVDAALNGITDALDLAAWLQKASIVSLLLESGKYNVNVGGRDGKTPLWWAVRHDDESLVKVLLERPDIDLNQYGGDERDGDLLTPIQLAEKLGRTNILEMLQRAGWAKCADTS